MKSEHHRYLGLCLPYALGRLHPRQRRFFENHLKTGCTECANELAEIYEAMSLLPLSLPPKPVPPSLRNKVLAAVQTGAGTPSNQRTEKLVAKVPTRQRPWFGYAVAMVVVVIVVALGLFTNSLIDRIGTQERLLATQQHELAALRDEVRRKEELLKVLRAPRMEMVLLKGLSPSPTAYGKIIWDPEQQLAIVHVAKLPQTPADKDYQLWIIKNKQPISAGVFSVRDEQESYFTVLGLGVSEKKEIEAFAVTLEPKGGLPQPSGAMYLLGSPSGQ